ncbi:MAG TPA: sensor histidine kinase [Vicinamibacterales bacterium]|nr:sensor histidine kinase [Vicinamibacterales bacterium]
MRPVWSSFRVRLVVGSLLWTAGLLYVAHLTFVLLFLGFAAFTQPVWITLTLVLATALMIAGARIVQHGMASFHELRRRLADVHTGRDRVVSGEFPAEVQPLVDDLNALLAHRDRRVADALARAGDLAHGLKTPLAVLRHEADRAAAAGHRDLAETLSQQVDRMHRQIDYHLAHARAAASGAAPGARCSVAESALGIVRTLERLHADRGLSIDVQVPEQHLVCGQREDLDEMLGNLLDNACKWARTRVAVSSANGDGRIVITVEDDGPGIAPSMREAVLQRGVRADQAAPGSGLGLAIARDLAELYEGSIALDESSLGGLRVQLQLPGPGVDRSGPVQVG